MNKNLENASKCEKTKIYECAHYEYEYDDFGKYCWCHCRESGHRKCPAEQIYSMQFCPYYRQGSLCGEWVITENEIRFANKFKEQMEQEKKEQETKERALLKYLKEKYES